MTDKIDIVRPSEVSVNPSEKQIPRNSVSSSISTDLKKDSLETVSSKVESIKPVTNKLSEFRSETLAQKQMNLQQAVEQINFELTSLQSEIGFSVDFETNKNIVTVTRKDSGEVVRQIPSETVLNIAHNIEKLKGVIFDKLI
jgi:flagellar protein FlaG